MRAVMLVLVLATLGMVVGAPTAAAAESATSGETTETTSSSDVSGGTATDPPGSGCRPTC